MNTSYVWWAIAIYIFISLLIAFMSRTGNQNNMVGYFLGDRKLGGFVSALSYNDLQRIYVSWTGRSNIPWWSWGAWI